MLKRVANSEDGNESANLHPDAPEIPEIFIAENNHDWKDDKWLSGAFRKHNYVVIKLSEHPQPSDIGRQTTFDDLSWKIDENQEGKNDWWYEESQVEAKAGKAQQAKASWPHKKHQACEDNKVKGLAW